MLFVMTPVDGWKPCDFQMVRDIELEKLMGRDPSFAAKCGNQDIERFHTEITKEICEDCPFRKSQESRYV